MSQFIRKGGRGDGAAGVSVAGRQSDEGHDEEGDDEFRILAFLPPTQEIWILPKKK